MSSDFLPKEPLSQVVFVHDYIQLVFHDSGFSIHNDSELLIDGVRYIRHKPGYCDALVSLIGQHVQLTAASDDVSLKLIFDSGAEFLVLDTGTGPEAWEYSSKDGPIVVESNA
jgi:hypothetical protein